MQNLKVGGNASVLSALFALYGLVEKLHQHAPCEEMWVIFLNVQERNCNKGMNVIIVVSSGTLIPALIDI